MNRVQRLISEMASDAEHIRTVAISAARDARAGSSVTSVDFRLNDDMFTVWPVYRAKDVYSSKPHWSFTVKTQDGTKVSELVLKHYRVGATWLEAEQVWTSGQFGRKGLATFLYIFASKFLGKPFKRSRTQSDEGSVLWKKRLNHVFNSTRGL